MTLTGCSKIDIIDFKSLKSLEKVYFCDTEQHNLLTFYYQLRLVPLVRFVHIDVPTLTLETFAGFLTNTVLMGRLKQKLVFTVNYFERKFAKMTSKSNFPGLHKSGLD